jgi:hypothetical protein
VNEERSLIVVSQLPEIQENLRLLRDEWEQKAKDAASMVCTEDTVQSISEMRAEMRKEFQLADAQRKEAKEIYLAPWNAVEVTFKECVKDAFTRADNSLKTLVDDFRNELKQKCYDDLKIWYTELIQSEGIDFLPLDLAMAMGNVKINLSDAKKNDPRKLKDGLANVVAKVAIDLSDINKMDDSAEIMVEYKQCLDIGKAVSTVQSRKRMIQEQKEAAEAQKMEQERRQAAEDKVLSFAPPIAQPKEETAIKNPEQVFEKFTFTVYGATRSQLIKVREFLKQEGINYG